MTTATLAARAAVAVEVAAERLRARRRADGGWTDRLSSSAVATGLAVVALARTGDAEHGPAVAAGLDWLRGAQRDDGGWSDADADPPGSKSGTAFAMAAFQAVGPGDAERRLAAGRRFLEAAGGVDRIPGMRGSGPRTWPAAAAIVWALVGLRAADRQPRQPVEVMLLPARLRHMVSIALPGVLALGVMQSRLIPAGSARRLLGRLAEPRALAWLRSVQGPNGGIEECPMLVALVLLGLTLAGVAPDVRAGCASYLRATQRPDGSWPVDRDLEVSATTYAVQALAEAGRIDGLEATRAWLLGAQWPRPFAPLGLPAGGWAWAGPSGWPESDDTAGALGALRLLGEPAGAAPVRAGVRWLLARQNRDGSWAEWVRNSALLNDRPCPAVTAHVVMALHGAGVRGRPVDRALRWIAGGQAADGSLGSLWFRGRVHGTARVLETLGAVGRRDDPVAGMARRWLLAHQEPGGGWGGTVEETAWALSGLLAGGAAPLDAPATRAVEWLVDRQRPDGSWPTSPVGLYFDDLRYGDDLIADTFALRALAGWLRRAEAA